jgi:hypothetical protein
VKANFRRGVSLSKLLEAKFSTLFDVGLRLSEGLSECVENFTSNSVENDIFDCGFPNYLKWIFLIQKR